MKETSQYCTLIKSEKGDEREKLALYIPWASRIDKTKGLFSQPGISSLCIRSQPSIYFNNISSDV